MTTSSLPRTMLRVLTVSFLLSTFAFAQHYTQKNLVSDISGNAAITDPNLKNAWGLARSATSPWWVADNSSGLSTLYQAAGTIVPLVVTIPSPPDGTGPAAPTGIIFNGTTGFVLANGKSAAFIFDTEDGTIAAWNGGTTAVLEVDNSHNKAVYKGLTLSEIHGVHYLYATNFRAGRVEVYDTNFHRVRLSEEDFDDDRLPRGFAPFNIQAIGENIIVTYAKQNAEKHDDVAGAGLGFVDVYSRSGRLVARLEHGPWLNSPWGIVMAPGEFGEFSHSLLIGNFGSGQIAAYNPVSARFEGLVRNLDNSILSIDGLWGLSFGNGAAAGPSTTLFFSAGPNGEADGLFGTLTPLPAELTEEDEP
jgi:uncharacterized protein (TIGR03118 family)